MVRPAAYPPNGVIRASFCKQPIASTQQMLSHGWVLGEVGVGTDEHYIFSLVFPHDGIEIAYLASVLFVKIGVGHTHEILMRVVVTKEATFFCFEKLFRAQKRSTVYRESGRCPLREARGRCQKNTTAGVQYSWVASNASAVAGA